MRELEDVSLLRQSQLRRVWKPLKESRELVVGTRQRDGAGSRLRPAGRGGYASLTQRVKILGSVWVQWIFQVHF